MASEKATAIVSLATQEIGEKESPAGSNKTKYGEWFGLNGEAWCGIFVSFIYSKAGAPLGKIGFSKGFAGCATAVEHFRKTGEVVSQQNVKAGDIVIYRFKTRPDHTGIFISHNADGTFTAIEGNTAIGNDSNGGEVMRRTRKFSQVELFAHPKVLDQI